MRKRVFVQVNQIVTATWNVTFYMESYSEEETNLPMIIYRIYFFHSSLNITFLDSTQPRSAMISCLNPRGIQAALSTCSHVL